LNRGRGEAIIQSMRRIWGALFVLGLVACGAAPGGLNVDVRTDLAPGVEFTSVQTEVSATPFVSAATSGNVTNAPAAATDDFLRGQRVADLATLQPGEWYVRVALLDHAGARVLTRTTILTLTTHYSLTVVLARACAHVTCPEAGDEPMATECNGGHCVVPRCSPETPEACTSVHACARDADCTSGACGRGSCVSGACLVVPDDTACHGGTCGADYTCAGGTDAGATDAGSDDARHCTASEAACANGMDDDCDGQADCADSDCAGVACDDGNACTHTDRCSGGACAGTAISCVDEPCRSHTCNGTASCTDANIRDGMGCPDDGNPCTGEFCGAGTCVHVPGTDNTSYDGMYYHRCCGGVPTQTGTDANCDGCGNDCGGNGCFTYLGIASCHCPVSNAFCDGLNRGTCYQGDYSGTPDGLGWLCQCQSDANCAPGQTCCMGGAPGFRHFCFFGSC
jgi:hypothetical protein